MRSAAVLPPQFEMFANPAKPANDGYAEITVGGLRTACLSRDELARLMLVDCLAARHADNHPPKLIFASNGHAIALAAKDENFRATLAKADIIHADGQAGVLASQLFTRTPVPERSATTDFIHDAAKAGAQNGLRFFLLGATEETNNAAAHILAQTYPGLVIAGRRHGYFGEFEEDQICDEINLTQPDVIWVGLSVPLEYEFAVRNKARLKAGWLVTCGGCFNFVAGSYKRAPAWMQAAGLEWLFRLVHEPKRLFWRYAVTNPLAIFLLLTRTNADLEPLAGNLPVSQALAA
jgi:N-acetylglucosaminyldiphosphoundecaprenol N-acetyl-beta-D-mannosaminyltransferase